MKIALIADVHSNAPALRSALQELDRRGDIAHIYCLGDMCSIGHATNEVLATLFGRPDVSMVVGNHDEYVLAVHDGREHDVPRVVLEHERWVAANLDPVFIPRLRALPRFLRVVHNGRRLLLRHYHDDQVLGYASFDLEPSAEKLDARYDGDEAEVVGFGHHHPVHLFRGQRLYINPGALGACDRPVARYAVLSLPAEGPVGVELGEAPYDPAEFLAAYERLQVPAREFIVRAFLGQA